MRSSDSSIRPRTRCRGARAAWAWVCTSARRSSPATADVSGPRAGPIRAARSPWPCRARAPRRRSGPPLPATSTLDPHLGEYQVVAAAAVEHRACIPSVHTYFERIAARRQVIGNRDAIVVLDLFAPTPRGGGPQVVGRLGVTLGDDARGPVEQVREHLPVVGGRAARGAPHEGQRQRLAGPERARAK